MCREAAPRGPGSRALLIIGADGAWIGGAAPAIVESFHQNVPMPRVRAPRRPRTVLAPLVRLAIRSLVTAATSGGRTGERDRSNRFPFLR
jgi:hypothetical protein